AIETMPTPTGSRADHRLPLKPSEIATVARRIADRLGGAGASAGGAAAAQAFKPAVEKFIAVVANDLAAHRGRSRVMAGDDQPREVQALAHAMNQTLGNAGRTVVYTDPVEAEPVSHIDSLRDLVADMNAGKVDLLVILSGNPVYTAPTDLNFAGAMNRVQ